MGGKRGEAWPPGGVESLPALVVYFRGGGISGGAGAPAGGSSRPPTAPSLEPSDSPAAWSALPGPQAVPRACVPWHSLIVLCWKEVKWKTGACGEQLHLQTDPRSASGTGSSRVTHQALWLQRVGVKRGSTPAGGAPWSSRAHREAVLCRCPGWWSHRGSASNPCRPLQVEGPPLQRSLCGVPSAA